MEELKPCPFCGEQPTVGHDHEGLVKVWCSNSSCLVWCSTGHFNKYDEAAKAWNGRTYAAPF